MRNSNPPAFLQCKWSDHPSNPIPQFNFLSETPIGFEPTTLWSVVRSSSIWATKPFFYFLGKYIFQLYKCSGSLLHCKRRKWDSNPQPKFLRATAFQERVFIRPVFLHYLCKLHHLHYLCRCLGDISKLPNYLGFTVIIYNRATCGIWTRLIPHWKCGAIPTRRKSHFIIVVPVGLEPTTYWLWVSCSNRLSYRTVVLF